MAKVVDAEQIGAHKRLQPALEAAISATGTQGGQRPGRVDVEDIEPTAAGFIAQARPIAEETIRLAEGAVDEGGMAEETLDDYIALRASLRPETPKSPDP